MYLQNPSLLMAWSNIMTVFGETHKSMELQGVWKINSLWPLKQAVGRLPMGELLSFNGLKHTSM